MRWSHSALKRSRGREVARSRGREVEVACGERGRERESERESKRASERARASARARERERGRQVEREWGGEGETGGKQHHLPGVFVVLVIPTPVNVGVNAALGKRGGGRRDSQREAEREERAVGGGTREAGWQACIEKHTHTESMHDYSPE